MTHRDPNCDDCRMETDGDCGRHGVPDVFQLTARAERAEKERDAALAALREIAGMPCELMARRRVKDGTVRALDLTRDPCGHCGPCKATEALK